MGRVWIRSGLDNATSDFGYSQRSGFTTVRIPPMYMSDAFVLLHFKLRLPMTRTFCALQSRTTVDVGANLWRPLGICNMISITSESPEPYSDECGARVSGTSECPSTLVRK